jgi:hypothetical protein
MMAFLVKGNGADDSAGRQSKKFGVKNLGILHG